MGEGHYYENQNIKKQTKTQENMENFLNHYYIETVFLVHHYNDKN